MVKLLLMSVLLCTFAFPAVLARRQNPRRALRALLLAMFAFELAYAFFLRFIYVHVV